MRVEIPYKPRKLWKEVIHPALDQRNRAVLVCHRRFAISFGELQMSYDPEISEWGNPP